MIGSLIDTVEERMSECNDSALEIIKIETEIKENEKNKQTPISEPSKNYGMMSNINAIAIPQWVRGMKQKKHLK